MLRQYRPIVFCEVLPGKVEREIEAVFRKHGYMMYRLDRENMVQVVGLAHDGTTGNDHLMIHPEKIDKIERFLDI